MLSRVADSIYWMGRYVERAENVARFVDVNLNLMLDAPDGSGQQWQPLVFTTGDHEDFAKHYGEATQQNVIQFLTFDRDNPNSIVSCLRAARENARSVREIISSEMWLQLNKFYLMVNSAATNPKGLESPHEFFTEVKLLSHLFTGVTDATMTHGEPWHFRQLGRELERADKTSRILDVKYFILLRSVSDVGTAFDDVQWAAVLRSTSSFEMYRKRHGRILPKKVVEFLVLDRNFPVQFTRACSAPATRFMQFRAHLWALSDIRRKNSWASFVRNFPTLRSRRFSPTDFMSTSTICKRRSTSSARASMRAFSPPRRLNLSRSQRYPKVP